METAQKMQKTGFAAIKEYFNSPGISQKFHELLGKKSVGFVTSVMQLCNNNKSLQNCDPAAVYQCAAMAAMLELPLNPNLGFAYIIPYNEKTGETDEKTGKDIYKLVPQFQMGYKGFMQLAQRSGQFQEINVSDVREGELISYDRLTGTPSFTWDITPERSSKKIIGFVGYFSLTNGFRKVVYRTADELQGHGKKYSKTYNLSSSKWKTDFEAMCSKTLIKLMLSKYAPLSIEMQQATIADQAAIKGIDEGFENAEFTYVDNDGEEEYDWDSLQILFTEKSLLLTKEVAADCTRIITAKEETSYAKILKLLEATK